MRLEKSLAIFGGHNALSHAGHRQLSARDFDGKFLIRGDTIADRFQNFPAARFLASHQVERMADLGQLQIRRCGAHDHVVTYAIEFDLLIFGAIFSRVLLALQERIEKHLRVIQLK